MKKLFKQIISLLLSLNFVFFFQTICIAQDGNYDFEDNTVKYVSQVQNQDWKQASGCSYSVSSDEYIEGNNSLFFSQLNQTDSKIYIFLNNFSLEKGKWANLSLRVDSNCSGVDSIGLFYRNSNGIFKYGTQYSLNQNSKYINDWWYTTSVYIPTDVTISGFGVYIYSSGNSGYNKAVYIDNFFTSNEQPADNSYKAEIITDFSDVSAINYIENEEQQQVEATVVEEGTDGFSLEVKASDKTYLSFNNTVEFTTGDWLNLRLKNENLEKVQIVYYTNQGKVFSDELSIEDVWCVLSFKKPDYSRNAIGLLLEGNGRLLIDGIYSSTEPLDLITKASQIKVYSNYFGVGNKFLRIEPNTEKSWVQNKFLSNINDMSTDVEKIETNADVNVNISGCTVYSYKIAVNGDLDGNGILDSNDIVKLINHLLGANGLEDAFLVAADVHSNDSSVNLLDFVALKKLFLGVDKREILTVSNDIADKTSALKDYLEDIYGKYTLSGQQFQITKYPEIACIYGVTGELPALMSFDIAGSELKTEISLKVKEAIKWHRDCNGIVSFMWHWSVPRDIDDLSKGYSCYKYWSGKTDGTQFSIANAVTKGTAENEYILMSLDNIAYQLKELEQAGVPVLWRPLHEASGGWFWWGSGSSSDYIKLWNIVYDRLENYHGLQNLIWVWNGQSSSWIPDIRTYDIASWDNYTVDSPTGSSFYSTLNEALPEKMLSLSEVASVPSINEMQASGVKWLYWNTWYGDYVYTSSQGKLVPNDAYTDAERLIENYTSEHVITLDELPLLSLENHREKPDVIKYYDTYGHINGENPQWQDGQITLEAELAEMVNCEYWGGEECSGFATVLWKGKTHDSDLVFTVEVPEGEAGEYIAEVYYVGKYGAKKNQLTCNGVGTGTVDYPESQDIVSVSVNVTLVDGINTLGFYHESGGWAWIDVDCIKLIKK